MFGRSQQSCDLGLEHEFRICFKSHNLEQKRLFWHVADRAYDPHVDEMVVTHSLLFRSHRAPCLVLGIH